MKKVYVLFLLFAIPFCVSAQTTIINSGNWTNSASWMSGTIASTSTDNVTMNTSTAITVQSGENLTSGSVSAGNNNTITVNSSASLNIGDNTHSQSLTAGTSMAIVANTGIIVIWGDLNVNNSLAITIQSPGQIIIKGNAILANNASLIVNGDLEIDGSFTAGTGTNITVNGNVAVYGPTSVGASSNVVGGGHFHTYGGCSSPSAGFCGTAPVELLYFNAEAKTSNIELKWSTASELNFDYFIISKSVDGVNYSQVATVQGQGTTNVRTEYSLIDEKPTLGRAYYKLTEVDLDKWVNPLKIVQINFTGEKSLNVYPNPLVGDKVNFELNFMPESGARVSITDMGGNVISDIALENQTTTLSSQLAPGFYLVKLRSNNYNAVTKLIVK